MFQACQNLPLAPKSLNYRCEIMPAADCLQCNFFCELSIRPHCTVDLSHAAAADLLNNSVHADLLPRIYAGARTPCSSSQDVDYGLIKNVLSCGLVRGKQGLHFLPQIVII